MPDTPAIADLPACHGHSRHVHAHHAQGHHAHGRGRENAASPPRFSLLGMSSGIRLAIVLPAITLLWLATFLVIGHG